MNQQITTALVICTSVLVLRAENPKPTILERFNSESGLEYLNGGRMGGEGSGVSSLPADRAYTSGDATDWLDETSGPLARLASATPLMTGLESFTVFMWYRPSCPMQPNATLFNAGPAALIWDEKSAQWVLRVEAQELGEAGDKKMNWFQSGREAPRVAWNAVDEWICMAAVWKREGNSVVFYQGTKKLPFIEANVRSRDTECLPAEEVQSKRIVGNSSRKEADRPFIGAIDNLRIYPSALTLEQINAVRVGDLSNL